MHGAEIVEVLVQFAHRVLIFLPIDDASSSVASTATLR